MEELSQEEMKKYIDNISKDTTEYLRGYPSSFKDYCKLYAENYDSMDIINKYYVCFRWETYLCKML